jgi:hypothetical protein
MLVLLRYRTHSLCEVAVCWRFQALPPARPVANTAAARGSPSRGKPAPVAPSSCDSPRWPHSLAACRVGLSPLMYIFSCHRYDAFPYHCWPCNSSRMRCIGYRRASSRIQNSYCTAARVICEIRGFQAVWRKFEPVRAPLPANHQPISFRASGSRARSPQV